MNPMGTSELFSLYPRYYVDSKSRDCADVEFIIQKGLLPLRSSYPPPSPGFRLEFPTSTFLDHHRRDSIPPRLSEHVFVRKRQVCA